MIFRPSATNSGRPYGITSASWSSSCRTAPRGGGQPVGDLCVCGGGFWHEIVMWQYHVTWRQGAVGLYAESACTYWCLGLFPSERSLRVNSSLRFRQHRNVWGSGLCTRPNQRCEKQNVLHWTSVFSCARLCFFLRLNLLFPFWCFMPFGVASYQILDFVHPKKQFNHT